tara:strand:- start:393 stop:587 length:195 start_codon:yes stop_codon:yes gene_type:complete
MGDSIMTKAWDWVIGRVSEPSSWAAAAAVLVGLSVMMGLSWMMWAGIVAAAMALVLREQGKSRD